MPGIRTTLFALLILSFSALIAEVSFAVEDNPLLGLWQAAPEPEQAGFERIGFERTIMRIEGAGDILVRAYRISARLAQVFIDGAGNFEFEILDKNRICLFPPRIQPATGVTSSLETERRCYTRVCWAPPSMMPAGQIPGCPHRTNQRRL